MKWFFHFKEEAVTFVDNNFNSLNLKRNNFYFLFFLAVSFSSTGQEIADTAFEKTIFWRITGNGLKDTSYLFGTMHPIFREDVYIANKVLYEFSRSTAIYFENTLPPNPDSVRIALTTMKKPNLKSLLGNICYKKLVEKLESYNDPILNDPLFDRYTPNHMNARIMKNVFGSKLTTIDDSLMILARMNDKKIFALDEPEVRERFSDPTTLDQQATILYDFLNDFEKNISDYYRNLKGITGKYLAGDIGFIYTRNNFVRLNNNWSGRSFVIRKSSAQELLDDRNKNWLPKIERACQSQASFFAFGVSHLAGMKGVISLLRKKGYTVTPIFLNN